MNDLDLMAEVFDGGYGDHPKLLPALQASSKYLNADVSARYADLVERGEFDVYGPLPGIERERSETLLMERIRVRQVYGN